MAYTPSSIAIASIMCAFGNEQQYVEEWRTLMMNNGIFQFDFVTSFKCDIQLKIRYRTQ